MKTAHEARAAMRAEIERLFEEAPSADDSRHYLGEVLSFLDTIEAEEKEPGHIYSEDGRLIASLPDTPKISGWVARDMNGGFWLHSNKPTRRDTDWFGMGFFQLCDNLFPDLKWEDEPIEVTLIVQSLI